MKRRIPNILLALIIGFVVALLRTPERIRDFTDTTNQTVDTLIAQDFGLAGAVVYRIVIGTLVWGLIAAVPLALLRRPSRPRGSSETSVQAATKEGPDESPQGLLPRAVHPNVAAIPDQPSPPVLPFSGSDRGSSTPATLFVVYVNHPTSKARIHSALCPEYLSRKADKTENGYWTSTFTTIEAANEYAQSTGKTLVDTCAICSP